MSWTLALLPSSGEEQIRRCMSSSTNAKCKLCGEIDVSTTGAGFLVSKEIFGMRYNI
jgi:ribosomal protein S27E